MSMSEYSLSDLATAAGGGMGGFGGENAFVLILLFAMIFGWGGNGFGGNNANAATASDIQRAVDLNGIQQGQAGISADIQRGIYEINGSTKDAAYNNLGEIRDVQAAIATGFANQQNCCCTTQRAIDGVNYNLATQSAAIQANDTANTQKILDAISQSKIDSLTAQVNGLQMQVALGNVVRYPSATTYTAGSSCFGTCGGTAY